MILEAARAIPVKNLSGWHAALPCLFGAETGRQYNMRLKGNKEYAQAFSEYLIPDKEKRNVYLIALIFWHGRLDVRAAEEAAQYYKAVKPLVSCLLWRE
ncbi:MAG: hypothetical protein HFG25_03735 [Lachnospiraceae bacterium]|nr:hypothetical protein [Lachnospiraceae bacterium]